MVWGKFYGINYNASSFGSSISDFFLIIKKKRKNILYYICILF